MRDAPDELSLAYVAPHRSRRTPTSRAEWHGAPAVAVAGMWAGDAAEGERVARRPARASAPPVADLFGAMPYADFQCALDDPPGYRNYWTAEQADDLPDERDRRDRRALPRASPPARRSCSSSAGAARWPASTREHSPLAERDARFVVHPLSLWEDPADDARGDRLGARVPRADGARTGPAAAT